MDLLQDIPQLSSSIWPYDTGLARDTSPVSQFNKFRCFVLCPFARADIVMLMVRQAAERLEPVVRHEIEVRFAGDIAGPGAIHPDIWANVKQSDIVVVDLTGYNSNVVYELGVAAAWRPIDTVIIIRDESDGLKMAFDLHPARQRLYDSRVPGWGDQISRWLRLDMFQCLSQVPFRDEKEYKLPLPYEYSFENNQDTTALWSPGPTHRRIMNGALEFGSPYYFAYSWLSPVGLRQPNIRIQAEMRFTFRDDLCWIGIAVRSQGYLANQGYLAWLGFNGEVRCTSPGEKVDEKNEVILGQIASFDPSSEKFLAFDISMDRDGWSIRIENIERHIPRTNLVPNFGPGRILFQAWRCRAEIRRFRIEGIGP